MNRDKLPAIHLRAKPEALKLRAAPESALAKFAPNVDGFEEGIKLSVNVEAGEIAILGEIGPSEWGYVGAATVKDALDRIGDAPVMILLNSPGGDAFEGVAIYNLLRQHKARVTVRVLGLAASAASVIAMGGDRCEMGTGTSMMIHSAWALVIGNQQDLRDFADVLDALDRSVAEIYAARTGLKQKEVLDMMQKETWMSASDCVDKHFADAEIKDEKRKTRASLRGATPPGDRPRAVVQLSANRPAGLPARPSITLKGNDMKKPIAEQIAALEARRAANVARIEEIQGAAEQRGEIKSAQEKEEFDTLMAEVDAVDAELQDYRRMEKLAVSKAKPAPKSPTTVEIDDPEQRPAGSGLRVRSNLAQGVPFVRLMKAQIMAKGILPLALQLAESNKRWSDESPEVAQHLKVQMASVSAGDTLTSGWASELVYPENVSSAFLEFLRPMTILGKIQGFTRVPFNVRWGTQTGGSTGYWVGQAKPIPISKLTVGSDSLGIAKAAGMVVLDKELVMSSNPSAEVLVRNDLSKQITQFLDQQFIAPDYAAVSNVNPASITNGVAPTAASNTTAAAFLTDTQTLFQTFDVNNLEGGGFFWVTTPKIARAISLMRTSLGEPLYPTVTPEGGTYLGYPLIVSGAAMQVGSPVTGEGNLFVLGHAPSIAMADDGGIAIDASEEASIQMLDNPTNDATTPTATTSVSMWQTGCVAIRAIRFMNWSKRRSFAVQYIKDAAYVAS